jgi:hypothetical protein
VSGSQFGGAPGTPSSGDPSVETFGYFGAPASPGGYGAFGQTLPPPEPPARTGWRTTSLVIVAVVGSLAALGGGRFVLDRLTHPMRSVALPTSTAGLQRIHNAQVDQVERSMKATLDPKTFIAPQVGAYGASASGQITALVMVATHPRTRDIAGAQAELQAGFTSGLSSDTHASALVPQDPGPLGGTLQCTTLQVTGRAPGSLCFWVDAGTVGMVFVEDNSRTPADLLTREVRADSEH